MAYKGVLIDKLVAKNGDMFTSDSKGGYTEAYDYNTLPDNAWVTKFMVITAFANVRPPVKVDFTSPESDSTFTINWQTDIPTGYTQTYAELLGNIPPKPVVYYLQSGTTYINAGKVFDGMDYDGTLVNSITWTLDGQTGFIVY